jgi:hypothetical protein
MHCVVMASGKMNVWNPESRIKIRVVCLRNRMSNAWIRDLDQRVLVTRRFWLVVFEQGSSKHYYEFSRSTQRSYGVHSRFSAGS